MHHPGFFHRAGPFALRDIAEKVGAVLTRDEEGSRMIADVKSLRNAGSDDLAFFDNRKYARQLAATQAGACILADANSKRAPRATATLTTAAPYNAFAQALRLFYEARQPVEARMRAVSSWIQLLGSEKGSPSS